MKTLWIAILIVLNWAPLVRANFRCQDVVAASTLGSAEASRLWASPFKDLRQRLKDRASISPEFALQLPLTSAEKELFRGSLSRVLQDVRARLEPELDRAWATGSLTKEVEIYRGAVARWAREIESLRGSDVTYKEMLVISYRVIGAIDIFNHVAQGDRYRLRHTNPTEAGSYLNFTYLLESAQKALQAGLVMVPTDRSLTIRDFNFLLGGGLAPIGLVDKDVFVDGQWMSPRTFFDHDVGHLLLNLIPSSRVSIHWASLFQEVQRWPLEQQAAAHVLIFNRTHEGVRPFDGTILPVITRNREVKVDEDEARRMLNFLIQELRENNYWDEILLKNQPSEASLRRLFYKVGEQLNAFLLRPRERHR